MSGERRPRRAGTPIDPDLLEGLHPDQAPRPPWRARTVQARERHDRTIGIPPREISMWPAHTPTGPRATLTERRQALLDDLRALVPPDPPPRLPVATATAAISSCARALRGQPTPVQEQLLAQAAGRFGLDPTTLTGLAVDTGTMVAQVTRRPASSLPGRASLNTLGETNLPLAVETCLARRHLRHAATRSDPDLPRLWILANALHHAAPANVILREAARSHGPLAAPRPEHHDLTGWYGVREAITELERTVTAARDGRAWLATADLFGRPIPIHIDHSAGGL